MSVSDKRKDIKSIQNKFTDKDKFTLMEILNNYDKLQSAKLCGKDTIIILDLLSDEIIDVIHSPGGQLTSTITCCCQ